VHYRLSKANQAWKDKLGIGTAARHPAQVEITVPWSKLSLTRDLTTGGATSSASFAVGVDVPEVQKSLRPTSLFMKLPITVLDNCQGEVVLPRIATGNVPAAGTEIANLTSADVAFGAANGGPQRLFASCTFSRQLLAQASQAGGESIDRILTTELLRALSFQIDTYFLQESGVNGQPIGLLNTAASLTSNTWGAAASWPNIVAAIKQLEANTIDAENAFFLLGTNTAAKWRQLLRGTSTGLFALEDSKVGPVPAYVSTFIGSTEQTVLADFSQLVLACFGDGVDVVYDPYSLASTGEIRITLNLYYQLFARRPQAFVVSTDSGAQ
jgi:HK97 family phage major capsid protein